MSLFGDPRIPWLGWDPCWGLWHLMYAMRCYCSILIWAPYWADLWQPLWWTLHMEYTELQEPKKSQFGQPWLLQRAAITCLCSLQPVFCLFPWPLWFLVMCIPLLLVIGHLCVRECADPSKCLSYLIKVFVLLALTFRWLDWTGLTLCVSGCA